MLTIAPSLNSLFLTGILILYILVIFFMNFTKIMKLGLYQKLTIISLITIAFGIHGLIHLGVEVNYDFNPYKWF
jgi:hypothetical protein